MFFCNIPGVPVAQKQTKFRIVNGVPIGYDPSSSDKKRIQGFIRQEAPETPLIGPIALYIVFYLPIPKSTSRSQRWLMTDGKILPTKKPDEDNLAYLITNSMNRIVYKDDSQICSKNVFKLYGDDPRTLILVEEFNKEHPNFDIIDMVSQLFYVI